MKNLLTLPAFLGLLLLGSSGCIVREPRQQAYYYQDGYYRERPGYWDRGHYYRYGRDRDGWRPREYDSYPQYGYHTYP